MKRAIILSASAGSGKTYQLALKYVCDIVRHPEKFRNILAVTFTNKATEEMKSRILREIDTLASGAKSSYVEEIRKATGLARRRYVARHFVRAHLYCTTTLDSAYSPSTVSFSASYVPLSKSLVSI